VSFSLADPAETWHAWELSSGSTSIVSVGEPLIAPDKNPVVAIKVLNTCADKRHEKFFSSEKAMLEALNEHAQFKNCVPKLIAAVESRWALLMTPVGVRLHASAITPAFVQEIFKYIDDMWKIKLVDLDLRGRNIMMVGAACSATAPRRFCACAQSL
jgi:hypothetical protein